MITKDFNTWVPFVGTVEDILDPLMLGRVKIRVINHDEGVDIKDLNWATPIMPNSASKGGVGVSGPFYMIGSKVIGFFLDGDIRQMPMVLGAFATIPGFPDLANHDVNKLAREINESTDKATGSEPPGAYAAKYPHNKVIETTSGHTIELDDTPGEERLHVRHKSGSYVEINKDGQVVIKAADNQFIITAGDSHSFTDKSAKIESKGKMLIKTMSKFDIMALGPCKITSASKITLTAPVVDLMGAVI